MSMDAFTAGLSPYNWIDQPDAVLSADTAALTGPVENVATYAAGEPWIAVNLSLSDGECNFTAIFSKGREIGCVGFLISERQDDSADVDFEPYISAGDKVRWMFSSDPEPGVDDGDLWDSEDHADADGDGNLACGVDATLGVHGLLTPKTTGVRRVDMKFTLAAVPSAPLDIARFGRIWAGPFRHFETNHDWGAETGWDKDGQNHDVRIWSAPFSAIPEAVAAADALAYGELYKISQQVSDDRQVFFWPRADRPAEAMFARFSTRGRFRARFITNMSTNNPGKHFAWAPSLAEDWLGV